MSSKYHHIKSYKIIFINLFFIFLCGNTEAQKYEAGIFLGGSNLISNIGSNAYVRPVGPVFGLWGAYNINKHLALSLTGHYTRLRAADRDAFEVYRKERGISFGKNLIDVSLLIHFNFFELPEKKSFALTPFVFIGTSGYVYNDYTTGLVNTRDFTYPTHENKPTENQEQLEYYSRQRKKAALALPFGLGIKMRYNYDWVVSLEIGFRATNNSNLDNSNPITKKEDLDKVRDYLLVNKTNNIQTDLGIGNPNMKAWYMFTGFRIGYSFGRPPCYYYD